MDPSDGPPKKKKRTKPKLPMWKNFVVSESEGTATCGHCGKVVKNRSDLAKSHLRACEDYNKFTRLQNDADTISPRTSNDTASSTVTSETWMQSTSKGIASFFDSMDPVENEVLRNKYADAVYGTAVSFNAISNPMWKEVYNRLRPKFEVPTREELSKDLLKESYERVSKLAVAYVEKSDYISIVIDGWSNVRKDAIINVVAMTPEPIFLEPIDTKGATK